MLRRLLAGSLMLVFSGAGALAQPPGTQYPMVTPSTARTPNVYVHESKAHQCCYSSVTARPALAMPLPPAGMPCGTEHTCCVSPGPANFAEVPSTSGPPRPDACRNEALPGDSDNLGARPVVAVPCSGSLLPYSALSTVLRI